MTDPVYIMSSQLNEYKKMAKDAGQRIEDYLESINAQFAEDKHSSQEIDAVRASVRAEELKVEAMPENNRREKKLKQKEREKLELHRLMLLALKWKIKDENYY